jgi:hypothetical protein
MIAIERRTVGRRILGGCVLGLALALLAGSSIGARAAAADKLPEPSDWIGSASPLQFLGQFSIRGSALMVPAPLGPEGRTHIGRIDGGTMTGPVLEDQILPAGEDWVTINPNGRYQWEVRMLLKTPDGAYIKIHYEGRWKGTDEMFKKIVSGQKVDPATYYHRTAIFFETTDPKYAWLNDIVAVGYGRADQGSGATISIFQIK